MERIYPQVDDINQMLEQIRLKNHIERYQLIKKYCYGNVLDIACGVGYGSYLLSNNPEIANVHGVDINQSAIQFAQSEYEVEDNVTFECCPIQEYDGHHNVIVSLETLEHLEEIHDFRDLVYRVGAEVVIVSFPTKKSTHFNPYHYQDLQNQHVVDLLDRYVLARLESQPDISIMVFVRLPLNTPAHVFNRSLVL